MTFRASSPRPGGEKRFVALLLLLFTIPLSAEIVPRAPCATDPEMSYAYYLPRAYTSDRRWPVLFVFDPRERGAFAAELFREAAEEYGWIVVSSNDTRSDDPAAPNARAVTAMWKDVPRRFSVDPKRVYATGFSGGAMLAWALAVNTRAVAGVIAVGGRVHDPKAIATIPFDWFGIAGEYDFNLAEMKLIHERLTVLGASRRLETFDGPHRWAPPATLRRGIDWMELQAMKRGTRPRDEGLIRRLYDEDIAFATSSRDALESMRRFQATIRTFDGLTETSEAARRATELGPATKPLLADELRANALESRHRQRMPGILNRFLQAEDTAQASDALRELEIGRLLKMANAKTYEGRAAQRVLETIFVQVSYYLPRQVTGPKAALLKGAAAQIRE